MHTYKRRKKRSTVARRLHSDFKSVPFNFHCCIELRSKTLKHECVSSSKRSVVCTCYECVCVCASRSVRQLRMRVQCRSVRKYNKYSERI